MTFKVFQGAVVDWKRSKEPYHGQCRAVIGAKSWREAHSIALQRYANITLGHMRGYWSITGNKTQIEAATKFPKTLLLSTSLGADDYEPQS
jgi:hypothetical protein